LLAAFEAERRLVPPPEPGVRYERAGGVIRAVGTWNGVLCADFTGNAVDAVIAEQAAFFRGTDLNARGHRGEACTACGRALEWTVYGHDVPPDLAVRLAAAGFAPEEPETLMVFDLACELSDDSDPGAQTGVEIRRVTDAGGAADAAAAARAAFARDDGWQAARAAEYLRRLSDPTLRLYVAYAGGRPVASARAEFPPGRAFAGIWGGGTMVEYRGRGIYRALVRTRAADARRRGYRYLRVDARETSRPILERLGFIALSSIVEWRLAL
jgi:ribosomal protein S18 acetylase RimI-like enzyme